MEVQENLSQGQEGLADNVNESLGVHPEHAESEQSETHEEGEKSEGSHSNETLAVQKRLKAQRRAHERETRELHARIGALESKLTNPNQQTQNQTMNPYSTPQNGGIDEQIHKAVSYALQHKEMEERKAHEMQSQAKVNRQYQELNKHLDNMGDKYDDFHDTVMGNDTPFTNAMRDYSLTLPKQGAGSAGEVLYKLGKNPQELERISRLHPIEQASEMAKLSHALMSGGETRSSTPKQMGNIKSNPVVNTNAVTDKTPIGNIRERMKSGSWK